MSRNKMTVVFEVKDREALNQLYAAHKDGSLVCGMSPNILAWGDHVTIPEEIISGLIELDPESLDKNEVAELVSLAEKHRGILAMS